MAMKIAGTKGSVERTRLQSPPCPPLDQISVPSTPDRTSENADPNVSEVSLVNRIDEGCKDSKKSGLKIGTVKSARSPLSPRNARNRRLIFDGMPSTFENVRRSKSGRLGLKREAGNFGFLSPGKELGQGRRIFKHANPATVPFKKKSGSSKGIFRNGESRNDDFDSPGENGKGVREGNYELLRRLEFPDNASSLKSEQGLSFISLASDLRSSNGAFDSGNGSQIQHSSTDLPVNKKQEKQGSQKEELPLGSGRVRSLVQAFEKMISLSENENQEVPEGRLSLESYKDETGYLQQNDVKFVGGIERRNSSCSYVRHNRSRSFIVNENSGNGETELATAVRKFEGRRKSASHLQSPARNVKGEWVSFRTPESKSKTVNQSTTDSGKKSRKHQHVLNSKTEGVVETSPNRMLQYDSPTKSSSQETKSPLQPFSLLTETRGAMKKNEFTKKIEKMLAEQEKMRIPLAQGLPWTTDEPEVVPKPPVKETTVPVEIKLVTEYRAQERAAYDEYVASKLSFIEQQKQEEERYLQMLEQEEIKIMRKEMVPRAQLMPFFDNPFVPAKSSKRLTVPKEPQFHLSPSKKAKCTSLLQDG